MIKGNGRKRLFDRSIVTGTPFEGTEPGDVVRIIPHSGDEIPIAIILDFQPTRDGAIADVWTSTGRRTMKSHEVRRATRTGSQDSVQANRIRRLAKDESDTRRSIINVVRTMAPLIGQRARLTLHLKTTTEELTRELGSLSK